MMFASFSQCTARLAEIEAIDYFFARELTQLAGSAHDNDFCLLLALSRAQRLGNSCLIVSELAGQHYFEHPDEVESGFTFAPLQALESRVEALVSQPQLGGRLHWHNGRLYTARYWQFEQQLVASIAVRSQPEPLSSGQISALLQAWPSLFSTSQGDEQDWQQVATALCINRAFAMLSGGPGTGKTYTVARLLMALQVAWQGQLNVVLTAPTGKAAQRLTESVDTALSQFASHPTLAQYSTAMQQPAMTLHRLLSMPRWGIQSRFNQHNPVPADVIIVDESSMIDLALMTRLFRALAPHTRVILVGDPKQLPSVEAGNVLGDIIAALDSASPQSVDEASAQQFATLCPHLPPLPVTHDNRPAAMHFALQRAQRFSGQLAEVARAMNNGSIDAVWAQLDEVDAGQTQQVEGVATSSFSALETHFESLATNWFGAISQADSLPAAMARLQASRWLTPFRQGEWGALGLNQRIERLLSPGNSRGFYRGRPIMITENHHGQRLYNGDIGLLWPDENGVLKAWFAAQDGAYRAIPIMRLPQHETVYAMTIHKSQGSEFSRLLLLVPQAPSRQAANLYSRELVYTGLTRAKTGAVLVTSQAILQDVVARRQQRKTGLTRLLAEAIGASR